MTKPRACATLPALMIIGLICCSAAFADETVLGGDSAAVLLRPSAPAASVILMPGGDGLINPGPNGLDYQVNRKSVGANAQRLRRSRP